MNTVLKIYSYSLIFVFSIPSFVYSMESEEEPDLFVFSHGLGSSSEKAKIYSKYHILPPNIHSFEYEQSKEFRPFSSINFSITLWNASLAQMPDVEILQKNINHLMNKPLICFGESCGASVLLRWLASDYMHTHKPKAVICDSPFACMQQVIAHKLSLWYLNKIIPPSMIERWLPYFYQGYQLDGLQPIDVVDQIPIDVPLLLACSREDDFIPYLGSVAIYKKLRERNHNKVHLFISETGKHGRLMKTGTLYRNIIHAFSAHYHIMHNPDYAEQGMKYFLEHCQPDVATIQ